MIVSNGRKDERTDGRNDAYHFYIRPLLPLANLV